MKDKNKTPLQVLREEGVQFRIDGSQDAEYEKAWNSKQANAWMEKYTIEGFLVEPMPTLKYTVEESKKIYDIVPKIDSFVKEKCQRWISGVENFEETYDDFLKTLNEMGLEEIIEINQTAYSRFIS